MTSDVYRATTDRLKGLLGDDDEDDRPTGEAYSRALGFLEAAAQRLGPSFPRAIAVSAGPENSVRLTWVLGQGEVRLVVGGSIRNRTYIYVRNGDWSEVDEAIDGESLASCLAWLQHLA